MEKIVYSEYSDIIPMVLKDDIPEKEAAIDVIDKQKEIDETTRDTKAAIEKIVSNNPIQISDSKFIKYKPSRRSAAFNSGAKERIINMVEIPIDPLHPPKFKHKKIPKSSFSPPVPVLSSPPRPVTVKDQQDWKIPPCVSNWKNQKGYVIPLDKRLIAGGGAVLHEVQINDNFPRLAEALYAAEQKAREAIAMRMKVQREVMMREKEMKEMELRELARKARTYLTKVPNGEKEDRDELLNRRRVREERRKDRASKKIKISRDMDRDISEKMALGLATTGGGAGEVMYDQRLFNQEKGMDSGFSVDDSYNVYDKGLFSTQSAIDILFKPKKEMDDEMYGGADERRGVRERPLEFEEEDVFGLNKFLRNMKTDSKMDV